jgi:hypothetical protein
LKAAVKANADTGRHLAVELVDKGAFGCLAAHLRRRHELYDVRVHLNHGPTLTPKCGHDAL